MISDFHLRTTTTTATTDRKQNWHNCEILIQKESEFLAGCCGRVDRNYLVQSERRQTKTRRVEVYAGIWHEINKLEIILIRAWDAAHGREAPFVRWILEI